MSAESMLDRILTDIMSGFSKMSSEVAQSHAENLKAITSAVSTISAQLADIQGTLDEVLAILLEPAPIAGVIISLEKKGNSMANKAMDVTVDFQLQDNGTATGTISFVDAVGEPTVPPTGSTVATSLTTSNPVLGATVDATGLVITLAPVPPIPQPLPTDMTVTAVVTVTPPAGAAALGPFTAVSEGIDLVPGPIAGAAISL